MTTTMKWLATAASLGLEVGVDSRNLIHVVIPGTSQRNCQQGGDGHGFADRFPDDESRLCMWCRELPGRERHRLRVEASL